LHDVAFLPDYPLSFHENIGIRGSNSVLGYRFISNKIVVNEKNAVTPTCIINTIQLCDYLL